MSWPAAAAPVEAGHGKGEAEWIAIWQGKAIALGMPDNEAISDEMIAEIKGYFSPTRDAETSAQEYMETVY